MPALSAQERRRQISARLCRAGNPVSAAALAGVLSLLTSAAGLPEVDVE